MSPATKKPLDPVAAESNPAPTPRADVATFAASRRGPQSVAAPDTATETLEGELISMAQAFEVLTPFEFAYFTRLMLEPLPTFSKGRKALARSMQVPVRNLDRALQQLERKGILIVEGATAPGKPSRVRFLRRLALIGPHHIAKLARVAGDGLADALGAVLERFEPAASIARLASVAASSEVAGVEDERETEPMTVPNSHDESDVRTPATSGDDDFEARLANWKPKQRDQKDNPPEEVIVVRSTDDESGASFISLRGKINKQKINKIREERADALSEARSRGQKIAHSRTREAKKTNEQYKCDPAARRVLSDPKSPEAAYARKMLERAPNERRRARLVIRLGSEYRRIYTAIRSKLEPNYQMSQSDFRACEKAAVSAVLHQVSAQVVIEHWRERVPHFTDMGFPLVRFLAGDARAEEAAIAQPDHPLAKHRAALRAKHRKSGAKVPVQNSFDRPLNEIEEVAKKILLAAGIPLETKSASWVIGVVKGVKEFKRLKGRTPLPTGSSDWAKAHALIHAAMEAGEL